MKLVTLREATVVLAFFVSLLAWQSVAWAGHLGIWCVSRASDGTQANKASQSSGISRNGSAIVYASDANNLVAGDTNNYADVFLNLRDQGTTARVSMLASGVQATGLSTTPAISGDLQFVVFASNAGNLVAGDGNGVFDIFVKDLSTNVITRESLQPTGGPTNGASTMPSISTNGHYVCFASDASTIVAGDTNARRDVFVRDRWFGLNLRASIANDGAQANQFSTEPSVSADGRYCVFRSQATNLVVSDTNGVDDIFLRDLELGTTELISVGAAGVQANNYSYWPDVSDDGRYVVFQSMASNLVTGDTNGSTDIFVRDRVLATTTRVSVATNGTAGTGTSQNSKISGDGRFIVFQSDAPVLVEGDTNGLTDVFLRDTLLGTTTRISVSDAGVQGTGSSSAPQISDFGAWTTFVSNAPNLVAGDTNNYDDIFLVKLRDATLVRGTVDLLGYLHPGNETVNIEVRSGDGSVVQAAPATELGPTGEFAFMCVASGTFDVVFQGRTWLRKKVSRIVIQGAEVAGIDVSLTNGDCDGSNFVNTDDYLIINDAFDTARGADAFDVRADLDGSDYVNTDDYLLMSSAFDLAGD